ncbi:MAG: isoprenylcysteine carboxylmethyltransferase family protein [Phycisphaerae bacterium]|nr:isoprenylcysteine carboxylmethyltransferase family protein [Phycisphaerae bacterium]
MKRQPVTETFDKILLAWLLLAVLALPVVAGLDAVRFGWSSLPMGCVYLGLALHVVGNALSLWTLVANPYLEKVVRIQTDRDHHVVTTGPYAWVRHPMYLGTIFLFAGIPLVLGSAWAFLPIGLSAIALVVRIPYEEGTLRHGLPGYEEYTQKVHYRLVPWVW